MDKFDQAIKNAKQHHEPPSDFIDSTMKIISHRVPKKHWGLKYWAPLVASLALIAIIFIVLPIGKGTPTRLSRQLTSSNSPTKATTTQTPITTPTPPTTTTPTAATDTSDLSNDLTGLNSSLAQENNDQTNANSGLDDSAQEITVPTD